MRLAADRTAANPNMKETTTTSVNWRNKGVSGLRKNNSPNVAIATPDSKYTLKWGCAEDYSKPIGLAIL